MSSDVLADRLMWLRSLMEEESVDVIVLTNPTSVFFFSGFSSIMGKGFAPFRPILLMEQRDEPILLVPWIEYHVACEESYLKQVRYYTPYPIYMGNAYTTAQSWEALIADIIHTKYPYISSIGLERAFISANTYLQLTSLLGTQIIKDVSQPIQVLRARKMPQELNYIHMAAEVASDALYEAVPLLQPGVRECDVARALAGVIYSSEAEFSHIVVASGERSVIPHGLPTSRRFQAMDLVVIDFGVLYKGYWAEICRTFAIKRATKRQKEIFGLVKEGQERAVRALKPGVKAYLVDQAVREYFVQAGFGECFIHSTGHGLGLGDQGDPPFIAPGSEHVVPECGAISLEPGLYLKSEGIGIRLEDAFLIHGERVQRVTSVPQELCIT